jgi:hypothetical protein
VSATESVTIIVPADYGLAVCDLGTLVVALADGHTLDEAVESAAIDELEPGDREHIARIRTLNQTGDATAYWGFDK